MHGGWSAGCPSLPCADSTFDYQGLVTDAACDSHGTHVASTAAGSDYGVAKEATLVAVQVLGCDAEGFHSAVIAGMDWAVADAAMSHPDKPAILSMSLGSPYSSETGNAAIEAAREAGVVVVAAAGNDNEDACNGWLSGRTL